MEIKEARFLISNTDPEKCPPPDKPEYAFFGRSNVGKSSLINRLTRRKSLAKTSAKPGKTRLINHFLINNAWYLVDLPGYGYARTARKERKNWQQFIRKYILLRQNLFCLFVLVDLRHAPLKSDLEFMEWLGVSKVPFAVIFTKSDKLLPGGIGQNMERYRKKMKETWDPLPPCFSFSAATGEGREELLRFIEQVNRENQLCFKN